MENENNIDRHDEAQEEILFPTSPEEAEAMQEEHWMDEPDDSNDDREALASAGHGMDEDYGFEIDSDIMDER